MFITFEGPEGGGKSTQITLLRQRLEAAGIRVVQSREPGGTAVGAELRAVLLVPERPAPIAKAQALLMSADRAQHIAEVILPALEAGSVVLSDRYADSTLAYQGFGEQLILADLEAITQFATDGLRPDLTVLVDVDVEVGLGRRRAAFRAGDGELNRIDRRDLAYHRRVRDGYHFLASREPERFLVVDGALPAGDIAGHVWARISTMLGRHQPLPALAR